MMTSRAVAYHPLILLKEKRRLKELEVQERALAELNGSAVPDGVAESEEEKEEETSSEEVRMIRAGKKFVIKVREMSEGSSKKYLEMLALTNASMNTAIDDDARKLIHKKFQQARTELDTFAKNTELEGEKIFSGIYAETPKELRVHPEKEESVSIVIPSLTATDLGLDRLKVDSLVNARKTMVDLQELEGFFEKLKASFTVKLDNLDFRLNRALINAGEGKKDELPKLTNKTMKEYYLLDLRTKQEELAKAFGEEVGLLVNTTG